MTHGQGHEGYASILALFIVGRQPVLDTLLHLFCAADGENLRAAGALSGFATVQTSELEFAASVLLRDCPQYGHSTVYDVPAHEFGT
ncbi:hypothetical protein [Bifidobacterium moukalabense]|uniref:hypothetical protein n=1 Tax=Bifidobacterium moukalabense TaxID=1333651 RepID=UPI0010F5A436|nr:hypothetical protein [Bifidobacterium moukalabense]